MDAPSRNGHPDPADPGPRTETGDLDGSWLTVAEAARRLGVSPRAVRRRVERGTLASRARGNAGREVWLPDGAASGTGPRTGRGPGPGTGDRSPGLVDLIAGLRHELAASLAMAAADREARARAEGRAEVLDAALAKAEGRTDRLEAALAEARRPWLARVISAWRR